MKKLCSIFLSLCLLLSAASLTAHAETEKIMIHDAHDLFELFAEQDNVLTIPEGAEVEIDGMTELDGKTVTIVNNGSVNISSGAVLDLFDCAFVNNGTLDIGTNAEMWANWGEGLANHGVVRLAGKLHIGALGAQGDEPQRVTLSSDGKISGENGGKVVLYDMDAERPADLPLASAALAESVMDADIYIRCRTFDELYALNADERVQGIFLRPRTPGELVRVNKSFELTKKLWIWSCDLLLEHGAVMTVEDYRDRIVMDRDARIVTESEGAAGPDCPTGGTLVLNGVAVMSGEADKGAVNPTRDIIWLAPPQYLEDFVYPYPPRAIMISDWCAADVHGEFGETLPNLTVAMDGRESAVRLTGDFTCSRFVVLGTLDLNGYTLTVNSDIFYSDCQIIENGGSVAGDAYYEISVDMANGSEVLGGWGGYDGEIICLEELGVDFDALDEDFAGWEVSSPWDVGQDALDAVEVLINTDESDDEYFGTHYIVQPPFPVRLTARWSGGENTVIHSLHLRVDRPQSGMTTETPRSGDDDGWLWWEQTEMPVVHLENNDSRLQGWISGWTQTGDRTTPFNGTFENGKTYELFADFIAKDGFTFADDLEIIADGVTYLGQNTLAETGDSYVSLRLSLKPVPHDVMHGDVNSDGSVTVVDATAIQRAAAGMDNAVFVDEVADFNGDGEINVVDATAIQRTAAGLDN